MEFKLSFCTYLYIPLFCIHIVPATVQEGLQYMTFCTDTYIKDTQLCDDSNRVIDLVSAHLYDWQGPDHNGRVCVYDRNDCGAEVVNVNTNLYNTIMLNCDGGHTCGGFQLTAYQIPQCNNHASDYLRVGYRCVLKDTTVTTSTGHPITSTRIGTAPIPTASNWPSNNGYEVTTVAQTIQLTSAVVENGTESEGTTQARYSSERGTKSMSTTGIAVGVSVGVLLVVIIVVVVICSRKIKSQAQTRKTSYENHAIPRDIVDVEATDSILQTGAKDVNEDNDDHVHILMEEPVKMTSPSDGKQEPLSSGPDLVLTTLPTPPATPETPAATTAPHEKSHDPNYDDVIFTDGDGPHQDLVNAEESTARAVPTSGASSTSAALAENIPGSPKDVYAEVNKPPHGREQSGAAAFMTDTEDSTPVSTGAAPAEEGVDDTGSPKNMYGVVNKSLDEGELEIHDNPNYVTTENKAGKLEMVEN